MRRCSMRRRLECAGVVAGALLVAGRFPGRRLRRGPAVTAAGSCSFWSGRRNFLLVAGNRELGLPRHGGGTRGVLVSGCRPVVAGRAGRLGTARTRETIHKLLCLSLVQTSDPRAHTHPVFIGPIRVRVVRLSRIFCTVVAGFLYGCRRIFVRLSQVRRARGRSFLAAFEGCGGLGKHYSPTRARRREALLANRFSRPSARRSRR